MPVPRSLRILLLALFSRTLVTTHRELCFFDPLLAYVLSLSARVSSSVSTSFGGASSGFPSSWFEAGALMSSFSPPAPTPSLTCTRVKSTSRLYGLEDIVRAPKGNYIVSHLDLPAVYYHPDVKKDPAVAVGMPSSSTPRLWSLSKQEVEPEREDDAQDLSAAPCEIKNWPKDVALIPHGISIRADVLAVVNHAYSKGGERIERFRVDGRTLRHLGGIELSSLVGYGTLNAVAILDDGESFLATTWVPPVLAHGKHGKQSGLSHQVKEILYALSGSPHTRIVWCRAGAKSADSCRLLDPPCRLCNGIALSKSGRRIFVADSLRRTIVAFDVKFADPAEPPKLERAWTTSLRRPLYPDNVRVDDKGDLYIAACGPVTQFLVHQSELRAWTDKLMHLSPAERLHAKPPSPTHDIGAAFVIPADQAEGEGPAPSLTPSIVLSGDEIGFGSFSSAIRADDGSWLFGSFADAGVLRCSAQ